MLGTLRRWLGPKAAIKLKDFWQVSQITPEGLLISPHRQGAMFLLKGLSSDLFMPEDLSRLHSRWRSSVNLEPLEELQIIYRKRVDFAGWVEKQLAKTFLAKSAYGRKILLDRLGSSLHQMSRPQPRLLSQKIIGTYWTARLLDSSELQEKLGQVEGLWSSLGLSFERLSAEAIYQEIESSAQSLANCDCESAGLPPIAIHADCLDVDEDRFRSLELNKLPEHFSELGMIRSLTELPLPLDLCVRLKGQDLPPVIRKLERKRNLLSARPGAAQKKPEQQVQMAQINEVLTSLTTTSEGLFDMSVTLGLRFPKEQSQLHNKALIKTLRAASQMDFCEFEETTLATFDAYLECLPGFSGKNLKRHRVLGSNAVHFLPLFCPPPGDKDPVVYFYTRKNSLYGLNPTDSKLANYNWLVSGTSGAGKSFFVNSLVGQSAVINPQIFIVDIGGSYNKMTQFLNGRVMSLEPERGFKISPFFLPASEDPSEEKIRRQHIFQIFLEMLRSEGQLPDLEARELLRDKLERLFELSDLPEKPISYLHHLLSEVESPEARRLTLLLKPWLYDQFFGQFLDNNKVLSQDESILTFDLKGLTEFDDLARVVQLIICSSLWAKVRKSDQQQFSWIVLDEVAFSLLKTQPQFVDELVSTMRKHFAGVIIVVQDLEKITSNPAGSSILQNSNSKAILQQRGASQNYAETLNLTKLDLAAIESLDREKGNFADIFIIRNGQKTVIRHKPSSLEYWLATTAPEDRLQYRQTVDGNEKSFQAKVIEFAAKKEGLP